MNTFGIAPTAGSSVEVREEIAGNAQIKLISVGTPKISVRVW